MQPRRELQHPARPVNTDRVVPFTCEPREIATGPTADVSHEGVRSSRNNEVSLRVNQRVDDVPPRAVPLRRRVVGALGLGAEPLIVVMVANNRGARLLVAVVGHAATIRAAPLHSSHRGYWSPRTGGYSSLPSGGDARYCAESSDAMSAMWRCAFSSRRSRAVVPAFQPVQA